jgi:cytoskeletal protein CcmA (bactofilin family)
LTVDSATTVTATFALVQETLTVELQGSPGTVAGAPFTCTSSQCTASVPYGTTVTLTATPPPASIFRGWSGGGCTGSGTCTLTLDSPITVDAEFAAAEALTVTTTGNGAGNVSGPSINCGEGGTICSANEPVGTSVMLLAAPGPGSTFTGWSSTPSECPHGGSAACSFTIEQATSVSATFVGTVELTVAVVGDGTVTGKVSTDEIIDCGESQTKCSASEPSGTTVVLTPGENGMWTIGPCAGSSGTCTFVLDADTNVTAAF